MKSNRILYRPAAVAPPVLDFLPIEYVRRKVIQSVYLATRECASRLDVGAKGFPDSIYALVYVGRGDRQTRTAIRASDSIDTQKLDERLLGTGQAACASRHGRCPGVGGNLAGLSAEPPCEVERTIVAGDQLIAYRYERAEHTGLGVSP